MKKKVDLFAPVGYVRLTNEQRKKIVNGCGTRGFNVPDTLWGLRITEACNIHDYMYQVGETNEDKEVADRVFLNNMIRIIESKGGFLKFLRKIRAKEYYLAVKHFGGPAFWSGKNLVDNYYTVEI